MNYEKYVKEFENDGCTIIKNFLSTEETENILKECDIIVNKMKPSEHRTVFKTGKSQVADDYFLNSGDKISFFFEENAFNETGDLVVEKNKALNKIGHALHWLNPVFKKISFHQNVKDLLMQLGYKDPVLVQSMVIFKHPKIGAEVIPHQDSAYLYTEPLSTIGLWFPLVDVTIDNGCLYFIPQSHKGPVHQRYVRKEGKESLAQLTGDFPTYDETEYKPLIAKKGDCVVIHGSVIHKSGKNYSKHSRPVYTFHIIEQEDTTYSNLNWLQPSTKLPFTSIYDVNED